MSLNDAAQKWMVVNGPDRATRLLFWDAVKRNEDIIDKYIAYAEHKTKLLPSIINS